MRSNKTIRNLYAQGRPGHIRDADYFYYDTAPRFNKQLAIVCGGWEDCDRDFEIERSSYPYFFIKYITQGKGMLHTKRKSFSLNKGTITGFTPHTYHRYLADKQNPMNHIFITFLGTEAKELFQRSGLDQSFALRVNEKDKIETLMKCILEFGFARDRYSQHICSNLLRTVFLILASRFNSSSTQQDQSLESYLTCRQFIENNFSIIKSPRDVADHCGLNVRYISSLFKKHSSTSPREFITALKMNRASNMLLNSTMSVKQIAASVGFDDPYHFSRSFKSFHGLAPKQYRQKYLDA